MESSSREKKVMACFRVPQSEYRAIRVHAASRDLTLQQILTEMLKRWMRQNNLDKEDTLGRDVLK